jgi:hypothetical protein
MRRLVILYNLILTLIIAIAAVLNAHHGHELLYALLFIPLVIYFAKTIFISFRSHRLSTLAMIKTNQPSLAAGNPSSVVRSPIIDGEVLSDADVQDINRRMFLKLIGAAGLATFVFAIFSKSAHAAFFGSVPGPGTVAIKDSQGNQINPAEKQVTDGFEISQVDDSTIPAYYGFLNKDGAWYIAREGNGGEYRYFRGNGNFASSWDGRANLAYNYFDSVF